MSTHRTPVPERTPASHPEPSRRRRSQRVPCWMCGADPTPTGARPRTMTGNISGLCARHEVQQTQGQP